MLFGFSARSQEPSAEDQIGKIAAESTCAATNWQDMGVAKKAYFRGMAMVFAEAVCQPDRTDVKVVAAARNSWHRI